MNQSMREVRRIGKIAGLTGTPAIIVRGARRAHAQGSASDPPSGAFLTYRTEKFTSRLEGG